MPGLGLSGLGLTGSIRRQLIAHFVLFALMLGTLFGVMTLLVFHRVEDRMVERRLQQMLTELPEDRAGAAVHYVGPPENAPPPFSERLDPLAPGLYEWEEDDRETHALIVSDPNSDRRTVAITGFPEAQAAETRLEIALLVGIAATSLLALALAWYLAKRIVSPIEQLTEQLATGALDTVVPESLASELRDDEVGTLARALERASRELTASAERERRFLREASHELRTPITVIQGVSDLLRESIDADDTVTQQRLDRLGRSLRRMNTSVLSLLAMARAEHRLMTTDTVSFRQQLEDMIEETRALAASGVELLHELRNEPSPEFANSMLILVLSNLSRNAVEHATSGSVRVSVDERRATVSDDGPGLRPELLDQLHSSGPQPDIGIGLATVQRICKRFGWRFDISCPPDGGTIATVEPPHS